MSMIHSSGPNERFAGVYALLLSPFTEDGALDWNAYDRYVDWQLSMRPHGLFAVCGSSEMGLLTVEERIALAKRAVERAGSIPVIATANVDVNIDNHVQEMQRMAETGVQAIVLIPPRDMGVNQERLEEYFANLADRSPLPVLLYECPLYKPHLIDAKVYSSLVHNHGIVGIKDTTCTVEGIQAKITAAPDGIVYQANTALMLEALRMGARGIMAITATAAVDVVLQLWNSAASSSDDATAIHQSLIQLNISLEMGYTATAKYLASLRGVPMSYETRSGRKLSPEAAAAIQAWHRSNC